MVLQGAAHRLIYLCRPCYQGSLHVVSAVNGDLLGGHWAFHRLPASVVVVDRGSCRLDSELFDCAKLPDLEGTTKILY